MVMWLEISSRFTGSSENEFPWQNFQKIADLRFFLMCSAAS